MKTWDGIPVLKRTRLERRRSLKKSAYKKGEPSFCSHNRTTAHLRGKKEIFSIKKGGRGKRKAFEREKGGTFCSGCGSGGSGRGGLNIQGRPLYSWGKRLNEQEKKSRDINQKLPWAS